jgi:hypothetical protein
MFLLFEALWTCMPHGWVMATLQYHSWYRSTSYVWQPLSIGKARHAP